MHIEMSLGLIETLLRAYRRYHGTLHSLRVDHRPIARSLCHSLSLVLLL